MAKNDWIMTKRDFLDVNGPAPHKNWHPFYGSDRFEQMFDYIKARGISVDDEDIAYHPQSYPFTASELILFFDSVMTVHRHSIVTTHNRGGTINIIDIRGLRFASQAGSGGVIAGVGPVPLDAAAPNPAL